MGTFTSPNWTENALGKVFDNRRLILSSELKSFVKKVVNTTFEHGSVEIVGNKLTWSWEFDRVVFDKKHGLLGQK